MRFPRLPLDACLVFGTIILGLGPAKAWGAFVDDPTTQFIVIQYAGPNQLDYLNDQQTGSSEGDLVGDASHPLFYMRFDDGGTPDLTDGTLAFRIRIGDDSNPAGFKGNLFIGIDANQNGAIDLFVAANHQGSNSQIAFYYPGTDANISPSTTSIVSPPFQTYVETANNYNFSPVNAVIDPTATDFDLFNDGTDYFLTFSFPFADLVAALASAAPGFNEESVVSYVVATATQDNSLNQDIGGTEGNINSSLTFAELGAMSNRITASGMPPVINAVPEPSSLGLSILGLVGVSLGALLRRRKT